MVRKWQLDITELTGHNLEARGREEVNRILDALATKSLKALSKL
jgi:hypothetical protein